MKTLIGFRLKAEDAAGLVTLFVFNYQAMQKMEENSAVTLIEMMIVTVIIGILATLGIAMYGEAQEREIDREAQASLRLIQSTQRIWFFENERDAFFATTAAPGPPAINEINNNLLIYLPSGANRNWDYFTWVNNNPPQVFCAEATRIFTLAPANVRRQIAGDTTWCISQARNQPPQDPVRGRCFGACPCPGC